MGDMGDTFRALSESTKEKKARQLAESDTSGFVHHSLHHHSKMVAGDRLDWWPSTRRWTYRGELHFGDQTALHGFIRNRRKERRNQ